MSKIYCHTDMGGCGCDYGHPCGEFLFEIPNVSSFEEALEWFKNSDHSEDWHIDPNGEASYNLVKFYKVEESMTVDLKSMWQKRLQEIEELKTNKLLEKEKQEYDRLKKKFENK